MLGRITNIDGDQVHFGDDLGENIRFADEASAAQKRFIDEYILRSGLEEPAAEPDTAEAVAPRLPEPPIRALDLPARGISAVIWCTGFDGDFSWARLPDLLNSRGQPIHERGITAWPGVYFVGLDFQSVRRSGTVGGVAADAQHVLATIAREAEHPEP